MVNFSVFLLVILGVLSSSFALKDTANVLYRTQLSEKCEATTARCCRFTSTCSIGYYLRASWNSEIDAKPSEVVCKTACARHRKKCDFACTCLAENNEVRSSKICKCRSAVEEIFVRNNCIRRCIDSETACVSKCLKGKRCPARATTTIGWLQPFKGNCAGVCPRRVFKPVLTTRCPVVATFASG